MARTDRLRLFAAVDPPDVVRAALDRVLGARPPGLRWTAPQQWHLTLAFYGEVAESRVPELAERLERAAARTSPLSLQLDGFGGFPSKLRATIVFAAVVGDTDPLGRLADRCAAAGRRTGIAMEERGYRPHLTVARTRGRERYDVTALPTLPPDLPSWRVESVRLVRSVLRPQAHHDMLMEWPLRAR